MGKRLDIDDKIRRILEEEKGPLITSIITKRLGKKVTSRTVLNHLKKMHDAEKIKKRPKYGRSAWILSKYKKKKEKVDEEIKLERTKKLKKLIERYKEEIEKTSFFESFKPKLEFHTERDYLFLELKERLFPGVLDLFEKIEKLKMKYIEYNAKRSVMIEKIKLRLEKKFGLKVTKEWLKGESITHRFPQWILKRGMYSIIDHETHYSTPEIDIRETIFSEYWVGAYALLVSKRDDLKGYLEKVIIEELENLDREELKEICNLLNELINIEKEIIKDLIVMLEKPFLY